jgi:hypothetical protein
MGIKGAKHVIAVNTDRDAPIFKLAELGIVADLEDVVAALLVAAGEGVTGADAGAGGSAGAAGASAAGAAAP